MFVPMVLSLWLIIAGMAWWQVRRIKETRTTLIYDQLEFLTKRLITLEEHQEDIEPYITYINDYYSTNYEYDDVTIELIDKDDATKVTTVTGPFVAIPPGKITGERGNFDVKEPGGKIKHYLYYYNPSPINDRYTVVSMIPITRKIAQDIVPITVKFWIIMISVGLFATFMAYISTGYIVSNINFLRAFTRRAAKGEDFDVNSVNQLPNDELGDISRDIVDIYLQLTEQIKRSEQEHQVALTAIDEKARIKRKLTANINHEIKTPIGIIKGYIDTIIGDPNMPEELKQKFLLKVQNNVDRLVELIADISVITKYENGEKLVSISEIDFHDLVFTFEDDLKMDNFGKEKIPFTFDVPLKCMISGNEALLRSMLSNLVRNARLYSQGTMCRLQFEREDDEFYYFSFYDDGVGVPPESLSRLFERFYRVNEGRERNDGGTGLGLPIVKVTIESFGGTIDVDNRIPSGLIFNFTLKKYKPTETERES